MRISDWSSDVCSSDLCPRPICREACAEVPQRFFVLSTASRVDSRKVSTRRVNLPWMKGGASKRYISGTGTSRSLPRTSKLSRVLSPSSSSLKRPRSEEHTSELQSLMRISYAVFCLKQNIQRTHKHTNDR